MGKRAGNPADHIQADERAGRIVDENALGRLGNKGFEPETNRILTLHPTQNRRAKPAIQPSGRTLVMRAIIPMNDDPDGPDGRMRGKTPDRMRQDRNAPQQGVLLRRQTAPAASPGAAPGRNNQSSNGHPASEIESACLVCLAVVRRSGNCGLCCSRLRN